MGKILLTGAGGFIGSLFTRMLLDKRYEVIGFDNLSRPSTNLVELCSNPNFTFIQGDILKEKDLSKAFSHDIDFVFHLAGLVGEPVCERRPQSWDVNVKGTENICEWTPSNVPLYFASTGSVFGKIAPGDICTEDYPCNPVSDYAKQKLAGEEFVLGHPKGVVYRFATLMGNSPNPRLNLLVNTLVWEGFYNRCLVIAQGQFRRSFVSVRDVCQAMYQSLWMPDQGYQQIYNVGNADGNTSKIALAEMIGRKLNVPIINADTYVDPDIRDYEIDFSKATKMFGFKASDSIETVVDQLIRAMPILENRPRYD